MEACANIFSGGNRLTFAPHPFTLVRKGKTCSNIYAPGFARSTTRSAFVILPAALLLEREFDGGENSLSNLREKMPTRRRAPSEPYSTAFSLTLLSTTFF